MKTRVLLALIAALPLACDGAATKPAVSADGFQPVPNISGIEAKVPDGVKPNGVGGAPGFHTDDDSFRFVLQELSDAEQGKTFEQAKSSAEELFFKSWMESKSTDDGWVLTYEASKINFDGDEPEEVGVVYSFEVRRKIGDKSYKCYGSIASADGLGTVVDACQSLRAS
jgi:hypothetical protein